MIFHFNTQRLCSILLNKSVEKRRKEKNVIQQYIRGSNEIIILIKKNEEKDGIENLGSFSSSGVSR